LKLLAINDQGEPLFVRDDSGHDYEIEPHWINGKLWQWPPLPPEREMFMGASRYWVEHRGDDIYVDFASGIYQATFAGPARRDAMYESLRESLPLICVPATKFYLANALSSVGAREQFLLRARTVEKLGGRVNDSVLERRAMVEIEEDNRVMPKIRPPGCSVRVRSFDEPATAAPRSEDRVHARRMEAIRRLYLPESILLYGHRSRVVP
jgi:hypothetical protein